MALVDVPIWEVSVSFVDRNRNTSRTSFNLPGALEYADAETSAIAVVAAIDAISLAPITGWQMSRGRVDTTAVPGIAPVGSQVEAKGTFTFRAANGQKSTFQIPGIDDTFVVIGSNIINQSAGAVQTYITTMLNTVLGAGNSPVTALGSDYVALFGVPHRHTVRNEEG